MNRDSPIAGLVIGAVAGAAILGVVLMACDTPDPQKDLPPEKVDLDENRRLVYTNPDQFPNVVAFCDGHTRIYVTTRDYATPVVVVDSPECSG